MWRPGPGLKAPARVFLSLRLKWRPAKRCLRGCVWLRQMSAWLCLAAALGARRRAKMAAELLLVVPAVADPHYCQAGQDTASAVTRG